MTAALRLFAISIVARLPLAMLSIALLVHTQRLTGSFGAAGLVTGVYAVALGAGGPLLGGLADRRGQTAVLLSSAVAGAGVLGVIAALRPGTPVAVLAGLAAVVGLASPPVGACLRTLLPRVLADPAAVRHAYAVDASASELTWIFGPPLALGIGALWSTGAALALAGLVLAGATAAFAAQPASRNWRPEPNFQRPRGGALQTPAMRTLVGVLLAVGVLFGAVEVGVAAAAGALGSTAAAGPLLGVWGAGSLAGGLLATRLGGAHRAAGLTAVLAALAAGHLTLVVAAGGVYTLAAALFVAGAAIAPTYAMVYAMIEDAAPAGTVTEAFAWVATAVAIGAAAGAASAGALADHAGATAAFAMAAAAGGCAVLATVARSRTLPAVVTPQPATA
jgi:MFS family permease